MQSPLEASERGLARSTNILMLDFYSLTIWYCNASHHNLICFLNTQSSPFSTGEKSPEWLSSSV